MSSVISQSLLEDVSSKLGALREAKRMFAEQLAPEFSFFDYFRSDELALSACIAGLLDPNGTHGQGSVFLQAFFAHMVDKKDLLFDFKSCEVRTEHQANDQRRIDIVLRFDDAIVGIENKPWAGDQNQQLSDYANYLEEKAVGKKWLLIYLCDRDPSPNSLPPDQWEKYLKNGNFIQCSFAQLGAWLNDCSTKAKALQVRIFIEELHKFVRMNVTGELDMTGEKETIRIIRESHRNLEAAFDISNALEATKVQLLERFHGELQKALGDAGFHLVWDDALFAGSTSCGFGVKFSHEQDIYLRFEFQLRGRSRLFWGLCREVKPANRDSIRWECINKMMMSEFGTHDTLESNMWPWYRESTKDIFGSEMRDWLTDPKPWLLLMSTIESGQGISSSIVKLAHRVHQALSGQISVLTPKNVGCT